MQYASGQKGGGPCTSARRALSRARALTSAKLSSHHEDTLGWAREEVTPHLQAYAARGHEHTHNVSLSSSPPHTKDTHKTKFQNAPLFTVLTQTDMPSPCTTGKKKKTTTRGHGCFASQAHNSSPPTASPVVRIHPRRRCMALPDLSRSRHVLALQHLERRRGQTAPCVAAVVLSTVTVSSAGYERLEKKTRERHKSTLAQRDKTSKRGTKWRLK